MTATQTIHRPGPFGLAALLTLALVSSPTIADSKGNGRYVQTNLVSDQPGLANQLGDTAVQRKVLVEPFELRR